jgi:uncharacterized Rmd1/YagE family protein
MFSSSSSHHHHQQEQRHPSDTPSGQHMGSVISSLNGSFRCSAYCTAHGFDLRLIEREFNGTSSGASVNHFVQYRLPSRATAARPATPPIIESAVPDDLVLSPPPSSHAAKDVFFFPYGAFVAWNTTPEEDRELLERLRHATCQPLPALDALAPHAVGGVTRLPANATLHQSLRTLEALAERPEMEEYAWTVGMNNVIDLQRDTIVVKTDDSKTKLALSFGLAASAKLNVVSELAIS